MGMVDLRASLACLCSRFRCQGWGVCARRGERHQPQALCQCSLARKLDSLHSSSRSQIARIAVRTKNTTRSERKHATTPAPNPQPKTSSALISAAPPPRLSPRQRTTAPAWRQTLSSSGTGGSFCETTVTSTQVSFGLTTACSEETHPELPRSARSRASPSPRSTAATRPPQPPSSGPRTRPMRTPA